MMQVDAKNLSVTELNELRTKLAAEKQRIITEINEYPPPIPACDQQFNFLLEERTRVTKLLRLVDALRAGELADFAAVAHLMQASDHR